MGFAQEFEIRDFMNDATESLFENTREDDGKPYRVSGEIEQKEPCSNCKKSVPRGAVICNHCGFDREKGTTLKRVYEKVDSQWQPAPGLSSRLGIFLAVQGLAFTATMIVIFSDGSPSPLVLSWMLGAALCAYILGTFPRIKLTRSKKGRVRLTRTWHACFVPLAPADIPWRDYGEIVVSQAHHTGFWDWVTVICLVPWGLFPAVLWWLFVLKADQCDVTLTREHGSATLLIFRCRSQDMAQEMADAIRNVTGLT
jgi:hypothetical protein